MYLTNINPKTHLLDVTDTKDGILSIPSFAVVIEKFGLECMTCIALTVDHYSPHKNYSLKERHIRAMRVVTGKSDAFNWGLDEIQLACKDYSALQFHEDLHELSLLREHRLKKIREIEEEKDDGQKMLKFKELKEIREQQKEFEKKLDFDRIEKDAPSINGYDLSRLEQKINNQKSFYHEQERIGETRHKEVNAKV